MQPCFTNVHYFAIACNVSANIASVCTSFSFVEQIAARDTQHMPALFSIWRSSLCPHTRWGCQMPKKQALFFVCVCARERERQAAHIHDTSIWGRNKISSFEQHEKRNIQDTFLFGDGWFCLNKYELFECGALQKTLVHMPDQNKMLAQWSFFSFFLFATIFIHYSILPFPTSMIASLRLQKHKLIKIVSFCRALFASNQWVSELWFYILRRETHTEFSR